MVLRKIIGLLISPFPSLMLLACLGGILFFYRAYRRKDLVLIYLPQLLLILCGYSGVANLITGGLEHSYPPIVSSNNLEKVEWIVVLGGGNRAADNAPAVGQATSSTLARITEALRLKVLFPEAKLLLSGGATSSDTTEAATMREIAHELGFKGEMVLEEKSQNTESQAMESEHYLGGKKFLLVTSGYHMKRAMALFQKIGLNPIAAPTELYFTKSAYLHGLNSIPSSHFLWLTEIGIKEYVGFYWAVITGRI